MKKIKIGNNYVGSEFPCFIVAEISANHGGKIENALKIIDYAARAGVNAVKLQTYTPNTITLNSKKKDFLIPKKSPWSKEKTLWNLYNKSHTPWSWHKRLFSKAKKNKIEIFSTPFDESSVDFLEELGCVAYKIASQEINHIPLIKKVAKTKKPVILSTGVSKIEDIKLAVQTLRNNGNEKIIILKCTSSYPSKLKELNLLTLQDLRKRFKIISGFSDHTIGSLAALASVALGANLVEKHFNLKNNQSVDDFFSMNHEDFRKMVKKIRNLEIAMGKIDYKLSKESAKHFIGRRSIYISKTLNKGDAITKKNIKVIRPNFGLHPKFFDKIIGRKVKKNLKIGMRLKLNYLKKT